MADNRDQHARAFNTTLTPPRQDVERPGGDYPRGGRQTVQVDSGERHASPTYAGGPGRGDNPDPGTAASDAQSGLSHHLPAMIPPAAPASPAAPPAP